jgi:hypothetical protein
MVGSEHGTNSFQGSCWIFQQLMVSQQEEQTESSTELQQLIGCIIAQAASH